jgi:hypothetical protein
MIAPTEAQIEEVAKQIYKAMRFERLDSTPEWDDLSNSLAQSEARFTARAVVNGWGHAELLAAKLGVDLSRPATPPSPEAPGEALAARPLLEKVARLDNSVGITVAEMRQLAGQAAAWLRSNPPGQPGAIEPRGCPIPGACSCVEPTPPAPAPAPEPGHVDELIHCLRIREQSLGSEGTNLVQLRDAAYFGRAATRLEQQESKLVALVQQLAEPAKALVVPVNEQPWNRPGWCDAEGRCWFCNSYSMGRWNYETPPDPAQDWGRLGTVTHSAPHWAIPRPGGCQLPSLSVYSYDAGESVRISRMGESNCWCIIASGLIPDWWFNLEMHYDFASAGAALAAIRLARQTAMKPEKA